MFPWFKKSKEEEVILLEPPMIGIAPLPKPIKRHKEVVIDYAIIEQIHKEFDTTAERLLAQAKEILGQEDVEAIMTKNRRLKELGFINSRTYKETKDRAAVIVHSKEQAELIQYYQTTYPTLKFLPIIELDRICEQYGLIYAPVGNYVGEIPDKNLENISKAPYLRHDDRIYDEYYVTISEYWDDAPKELQRWLDGKQIIYSGAVTSDGSPSEDALKRCIINMGYAGSFGRYIFRHAQLEKIERKGLFIAAPKSDFDLSNLKKTSKFEYAFATTKEIQDPIVFRYVKGGIQVLDKWGLEGKDEALVNEVMN